MGAFTIHALSLTVLYIIYMAVTVAFDLHGKKAEKKGDAEEFNTADVGDQEEESSTVIEETEEGGFAIYHKKEEEGQCAATNEQAQSDEGSADDSQDDVQQEQPVSDDGDSVMEQESEDSMSDFQRLEAEKEQQLSDVIATYQQQYDSKSMAEKMSETINDEDDLMKRVVKHRK